MLLIEFIPIIHIGERNLRGKLHDYVAKFLESPEEDFAFTNLSGELEYIIAFGKKITEFVPSLDENFIIITELIAGSISFTVSEKETLLLKISGNEFCLEWIIQLASLLVDERVELFKDYEEKK